MDESLTYGDEDFDAVGDPEGDPVAYGGGQQEEQQDEERAPVETAIAAPAAPATPQATNALDPILWERYKAIRQSLSSLDGDEKVIDQMALGLAQSWHKELSSLKDEIRNTTDSLYFNTAEGQQVRQLMAKVPSLSRQSAIDLIRMSNENHRVTMERGRAGSPKKPQGYQLTKHDKNVAAALKISEADYAKELDDIGKGVNVDYTHVASGELIINNVM